MRHTPTPIPKLDVETVRLMLGDMAGHNYGKRQTEQAAQIVKACDSHAALLEALKAMVKAYPDCLNDILNPCWDAARSAKQEYGKHWGGGQACAVCISKQAIAQYEGGAWQ